jgi:hypothetical protein
MDFEIFALITIAHFLQNSALFVSITLGAYHKGAFGPSIRKSRAIFFFLAAFKIPAGNGLIGLGIMMIHGISHIFVYRLIEIF